MVVVYFGQDDGYTRSKARSDIQKSIQTAGIDDVSRYDGYNNPVGEVVEDCLSLSLFGSKRAVIFDNAYFLSTSGRQTKGTVKESQQDYKGLIQYLKAPSEDVDLYFISNGNLDSKNEVVQALKDVSAKFENCQEMSKDDFVSYALGYCRKQGKKINRPAAEMLYDRTSRKDGFQTHGHFTQFTNELDKMMLYTGNIFEGTVEEMVHKPLEDNVFDIVSNLFRRNTDAALKCYRDIRQSGYDPLQLIPIFTSQFRFLALVRYDMDRKLSKEESARNLHVTTGRLYYSQKEAGLITYNRLIQVLSQLGIIERDVKLNGDDADDRLMLFLSLFTRTYL